MSKQLIPTNEKTAVYRDGETEEEYKTRIRRELGECYRKATKAWRNR